MNKILLQFLTQGWIVISVVYSITFLLMLPLKNLAFFDDFAYIRTVERLFLTGELKLSEWTTVAMVFQAYWSLLFTKIFGFSMSVLHLSNIVLFYIGLIFFYLLLKRLSFEKGKAIFYTLFLLGFPWIFQFIYSFMSDTFYVSLSIITFYFYVRGLQNNSYFSYLLGGLFAGFTFLTRQIGVGIPLAFIVIIFFCALSQKKYLWKQLLASQVFFIICVAFYFIRQSITGPTAAYSFMVVDSIQTGILPYLLPLKLGQTGITNSYYVETLIQRGLGYFSTMMVFLLPLFFSHNLNLNEIFSSLKKSKRLLVFVTFVTCLFYYVDYALKSKFSSNYSVEVTRYDTSFFDWSYIWQKIIWISLPIWIIVITLSLKKIETTFFEKTSNPNRNLLNKLLAGYLLVIPLVFLMIYRASYPTMFSFNSLDSVRSINLMFKNLFTEFTVLTFINSWLFISLIFTTTSFITYFLIYKKIKKITTPKLVFLFLFLSFLFKSILVLGFAFFYWTEYLIQLMPLLVIFMAYFFRPFKLNKIVATLVILLILFFSVTTTRHRYQIEGNKWELGTKMIEKGISPYHISEVNWAWRPYWFFEKNFQEEIKKHQGNKLKAAKNNFQPWLKINVPGINYEQIPIDKDNIPSALKDRIILESESFWVFDKKRFVEKRIILYQVP